MGLCAKGDYESARAWTSANTNYMSRNMNNNHQMFALANYAQQNVALDHQMQRQMQTELMDEMDDLQPQMESHSAFSFAEPSLPAKSAPRREKGKKRKEAKNDKFSSAMYSMKRKAMK